MEEAGTKSQKNKPKGGESQTDSDRLKKNSKKKKISVPFNPKGQQDSRTTLRRGLRRGAAAQKETMTQRKILSE